MILYERWSGVAFGLAVGTTAFSGTARAQQTFVCPAPFPVQPAKHGQWEGPYTIQTIGAQGAFQREIAHAVVLPDVSGQLLLWCNVDKAQLPTNAQTRTYLWRPSAPQRATLALVPNLASGRQDLFCGGHTFLANGDLLAFGGTDLGGPQFTGHKAVYRFSITQQVWPGTQGTPLEPFLNTERWYPNAFLWDTNELRVLGHQDQPTLTPPIPERYDWRSSTGAWTEKLNLRFKDPAGGADCSGTQLVAVGDYPRAHLLGKAQMLIYPQTGGDGSVPGMVPTWFIEGAPACSPTQSRWHETNPAGGLRRVEGNSVHFVTYDASGQVHDLVYTMAGYSHATGTLVSTVQKTLDPGPNSMSWSNAPSLLGEMRIDSNAVILPTGQILIVGGDHDLEESIKVPANTPLLYMPPEIGGYDTGSWCPMADHSHPRTYHSVAGLLPDGRVFVAGGDYNESGIDARHSIELYRPPYFFWGPRPVISSVSHSTWDLLASPPVTINVTTASSSVGIERVCLTAC